MRMILLIALGGAAVMAGEGALMASDVIVNPHLTTDRAVDTASVKTMVGSLIRPGMTDQEKALAVYHYIRRTMFHYRYLTDFAGGGTMDLINGVGYCLCTPTAGTQARLTTEAGVAAHVLDTPGHGSVCVQWDGKWHWMDAFLGGCAWDKDRKTVASLEELVADPSLLRRENPSPTVLFPCGAVLFEDSVRWEPGNKKYHEECGPDDFAWTARAKPGKHQPMIWDDVSSLAVTLRPGEVYVRNWDNEPGMFFLFKTEEKYAPPHHICGLEAEQRDTVNWPYWKPYVRDITSTDPHTGRPRTVKTGRYWANGRLTWKPVFGSADALARFARAENARVEGGAVVPADPSKPAVLEWDVALPYMLQGGQMSLGASGAEGKLAASIAIPARKKGKVDANAPLVFEPLAVQPGNARMSADLRPHFVKNMGTRSCRLRWELTGKDARLAGLELAVVFQHNMYALPQLMPGANRVKVVLANPEALKKTRFVVEYAWDQDGKTRAERKVIDRSPFEFTLDIPAGPDLPRMRHLLLANEGPAGS